MKKLTAFLFCFIVGVVHAELQPEPIPAVATLTTPYADTYLFAHDANFHSLIAGKVVLLDVAARTKEYKGAIDAAQMASFVASREGESLYVAESFYSRGTSGERTDVVSIYNKKTLVKTSEIILPKKNRAQIVINKYMLRLIDNERLLLVLGFTPASSVIVIDTQLGRIVSEVAIPGCNMIYPSGKRGFSSLCGDGSMLSISLDKKGVESDRFKTEPFFSVDDDPVFDKPVYFGSTAYFVSYQSNVYPVDMGGKKPKPLAPWSLLSKQDFADNWRPGGWQVLAVDDAGKLYVIMHKNGYNGSHKFGGEEVWVYDPIAQKQERKLPMKTNAFSIETTVGEAPLLAVTNTEMGLDIYDAKGAFQQYINVGDTAMPLMLHAAGR